MTTHGNRENVRKYALAIKSCHKHADRRQMQLDTWLKHVDDDFFFVLGKGDGKVILDSLACDVSDDFKNIAPKVLAAVEYSLEQNVTNLVVVDDDTYLCWPRMLASGFHKFDYFGFVRSYSEYPYMQGSCFTLSERAMERIMKNKHHMTNGIPDDVAVGRCLYGEVPFTHEHRFSVSVPYPDPAWWPNKKNNVIAAHKMNFMTMHACHDALVTS
jgi:hypothetical protein